MAAAAWPSQYAATIVRHHRLSRASPEARLGLAACHVRDTAAAARRRRVDPLSTRDRLRCTHRAAGGT